MYQTYLVVVEILVLEFLATGEFYLVPDDLEAILSYVAVLQQLDTSGLEPMSHPGGGAPLPLPRRDETQPGLGAAAALAGAPASGGQCFKVPRVIERLES